MSGRVVHVDDNVPGAVYIGRAMPRQGLKESEFANPFKVDVSCSRAECLAAYCLYLSDNLMAQLPKLRGKVLACWCRHDGEPMHYHKNRCHGDILIELLDRYTDDELRAMAE